MFELHPQLQKDTVKIGSLPLSEVLLMNDTNYPWLILVPRYPEISELHQLSDTDQQQFIRESSFVSARMQKHFQADKMNVAALGNMVPQLHIHHIARYHSDDAWPGPVWGVQPAKPYGEDELQAQKVSLQAVLTDMLE